jgi:hypothetical protein
MIRGLIGHNNLSSAGEESVRDVRGNTKNNFIGKERCGTSVGGLYGLVFALLCAPRAVSAGAGLVWGLGYSFILCRRQGCPCRRAFSQ